MKRNLGFTLIEVLLALAVIAIALTALLKINTQNIANTKRLRDKAISHWVAMQGVSMIQLGLLEFDPIQTSTQATTLLNEKWYWRVKISPTPIKSIQVMTISTSLKQSGPFMDELTAFRFVL